MGGFPGAAGSVDTGHRRETPERRLLPCGLLVCAGQGNRPSLSRSASRAACPSQSQRHCPAAHGACAGDTNSKRSPLSTDPPQPAPSRPAGARSPSPRPRAAGRGQRRIIVAARDLEPFSFYARAPCSASVWLWPDSPGADRERPRGDGEPGRTKRARKGRKRPRNHRNHRRRSRVGAPRGWQIGRRR